MQVDFKCYRYLVYATDRYAFPHDGVIAGPLVSCAVKTPWGAPADYPYDLVFASCRNLLTSFSVRLQINGIYNAFRICFVFRGKRTSD